MSGVRGHRPLALGVTSCYVRGLSLFSVCMVEISVLSSLKDVGRAFWGIVVAVVALLTARKGFSNKRNKLSARMRQKKNAVYRTSLVCHSLIRTLYLSTVWNPTCNCGSLWFNSPLGLRDGRLNNGFGLFLSGT
ncbi:hypothetical protein BX666DRAFT_1895493 [Dichotomocladium elegans]|nr:hypothetical protein BX666DRAFT_1895493 [Dichotomocladium elegans]